MRPRRDPPRRRGRRRRLAGRALAAARRRARDRRGDTDDRGRDAGRRAAARRRGGRGRAGTSTASASSRPRSRTRTSRPWGTRSRERRTDDHAGYGFREAVRRKVFAVVARCSRRPSSSSSGSRTHYVFSRLSTITPPADVNVDTRTFAGAFLLGLAMFATLFLRSRACGLPHARRRLGRRGARTAAAARRAPGRPGDRCCSRASSAPPWSASSTCWPSTGLP